MTCVCVCVLTGQNSDYTTGQVFDLSEKLEQSEAQLGRGSFMLGLDTHDRKSEDKLAKATRDRSVFFICSFSEKSLNLFNHETHFFNLMELLFVCPFGIKLF